MSTGIRHCLTCGWDAVHTGNQCWVCRECPTRRTRMGNVVKAITVTDTEVVFERVDGTRGQRRVSLRRWQSWTPVWEEN